MILIKRHLMILFLVFFLFPCFGADAADIRVSWDETTLNSDGTPCTDLAGYKIYYDTDRTGAPYDGAGIEQGDSPIDFPLFSLRTPALPEILLTGPAPGTYYIVVTGYDTSGNESGYSNEVAVVIPPPPPPPPPADTTAPAVPTGLKGEVIQSP